MLLNDFVADLKQNGIAEEEIRTQIDPDYGIVMFQMPYKGMNVSVWAYEDPTINELCIRVTVPKRPLLREGEVLKALNKFNSEVGEYTYFIDVDFPDEIGAGKRFPLNAPTEKMNVANLYTEIIMACDILKDNLADMLEIHED